ncbi:MAG: hypothetical protein AMXMBFR47_08340 [Planctomycetota bacterium]
MIPPHVVADLCRLGQLGESSSVDARVILQRLAPWDEINCRHWSDWNAVTDELELAALADLVRGLTLTEEVLRWSGGSVSGVIWTWRAYQRRDPPAARTLAEWVMAHSTNDWAPFGSLRGGARSLAGFAAHQEWRACRRVEAAQRQIDQQSAARQRREARARAAEEHARRHRQSNISRRARIAEMATWPLEKRLWALAADADHAPRWYTDAWADEAAGKASGLEPQLRANLAQTLAPQRKGAWGRLARALRDWRNRPESADNSTDRQENGGQ